MMPKRQIGRRFSAFFFSPAASLPETLRSMAKRPKMNTVAFPDAPAIPLIPANLSLDVLKKLQGEIDQRIQELACRKTLCLNCQQEFTTKRHWQKYCSRKCRNEHFWKTHEVVKTDNGNVELE